WVGMFYDAAGARSQRFAIYNSDDLSVVSALANISATFDGGANTGAASPPLFGPCYSAETPSYALCLLSVTTGTLQTRTMYSFLIAGDGTIPATPTFRAYAHMLP